MKILSRMRRQKAVYWAPTGTVADGEATFAKPIELRVRWEGMLFMTRDDPRTKEESSREVVYVDRILKRGGFLWKGSLSELPAEKKTAPYTPTVGTDDTAREITRVGEYPRLRNRGPTVLPANMALRYAIL